MALIKFCLFSVESLILVEGDRTKYDSLHSPAGKEMSGMIQGEGLNKTSMSGTLPSSECSPGKPQPVSTDNLDLPFLLICFGIKLRVPSTGF